MCLELLSPEPGPDAVFLVSDAEGRPIGRVEAPHLVRVADNVYRLPARPASAPAAA